MRIIHPGESVPALSLYHTVEHHAHRTIVTDSRTGESTEWDYPEKPGGASLVTEGGALVFVAWGHPLHKRVLTVGGAVEASIRGES